MVVVIIITSICMMYNKNYYITISSMYDGFGKYNVSVK